MSVDEEKHILEKRKYLQQIESGKVDVNMMNNGTRS